MNRLGFLKRLAAPVAVVAAGQAAKLDPDGEPVREYDGQVVINGDGVTIANATFLTPPGAKAGISIGAGATGAYLRDINVNVPDLRTL